MSFLNRQWLERTLLLATVVAVTAAFTSSVSAQGYDTAYVPFLVNADATVKAELKEGATVLSQAQMSVTAGNQAILRIPLQKTDGIRFFGTQRQTNVPAIISSRNGKVTLNLPAQSYRSAEVLLYTINGKRVLRSNVSASSAANSITRPNLAIGIYLLSVRGPDGGIVTSRMTHGGGSLDISVAFGGENLRQTAKSAATGYWTITVTAAEAGYVGVSYPFSPVAGTNNELQNINLPIVSDGEYAVTVLGGGSGASGSGSYAPGTRVNIYAGEIPFGHKFGSWTTESNGVIFVSATNVATTFTMPANAVTVKANFETAPTYAVTVSSAGTGASGSGNYVDGVTVTISAGTAPTGQRFKNWTSTSAGVNFADSNRATTTFTMPANAVTVTANFEPNTYMVTVSAGTGATGSGDYSPGAAVSITAGTLSTGFTFNGWTSSNGDVVFADATNAMTTFIMPSSAVTVWASFSGSNAFTDPRDGKQYKTVFIGGNMWMGENLNYQTSSGSLCYENDNSKCDEYGRLYDWNTAMIACPIGWHLPYSEDWEDLVTTLGGEDVAGKKLKSTSGWSNNGNGTDDYGFSAKPGGFIENGNSHCEVGCDVGSYGGWWTATEYSDNRVYARDTNYGCTCLMVGGNVKSNGFSVRCIADD